MSGVTHKVAQDMPDWSLDSGQGGIIGLGSAVIDKRVIVSNEPITCLHFAPLVVAGGVPARCRRPRGHDGAHEIVIVWLP